MQDERMNRKARAECLRVMDDSYVIDLALGIVRLALERDRPEYDRKVRTAARDIADWAYRLERAASTLDEEDT